MKRIVLLFAVSSLLVLAFAVPAFAKQPAENKDRQESVENNCKKAPLSAKLLGSGEVRKRDN